MMELPWLSSNSATGGFRSESRKRFSGFFHGSSTLESEQARDRQVQPRKGSWLALQRHPLNGNLRVCYYKARISVLRSPSSTRSVIDPSSSPQNGTRPLSGTTFGYPRQTYPSIISRRAAGSSNLRGERIRSRQFGTPDSTNAPLWRSWGKSSRACTPRSRSKAIRKRAVICGVSGSILALILTVYLALALSNSISGQDIHIVLILITLAFMVVFCHSFIRLCMLARRRRARNYPLGESESAVVDVQGYADLIQPIQVALADDEELGHAGGEVDSGEELALPPPVYGLWRGSVRADPALLYWQRSDPSEYHGNEMVEGINRPPSYMSEEVLVLDAMRYHPESIGQRP